MYYLFIMRQVTCLFVYTGKNPRFTAFLGSNLHTRLAIVTKNELGLAFPPRNLPKKFRPDPSTFYLVIVVTNRQTDRQTNAGDYIIPRESFRGDNNSVIFSFPGNWVAGSKSDNKQIWRWCRPNFVPYLCHLHGFRRHLVGKTLKNATH